MKLVDYADLTATLRLKSGLHIGTGEKVDRGDALPVMESLTTGLPYIPGSSLKGKMRFLLELAYGRRATNPKDDGSPCWCGKCHICTLFGSGDSNTTFEPTRLIFRDSHLTTHSAGIIENIGLEEKPGVRIDRNTGKAAKGALFPMNRIPEGSLFSFEISIRVFENDNTDTIKQWLEVGLYLMEKDAIGGGGSRGSGQIEFDDVLFHGESLNGEWRNWCKENMSTLQDTPIKVPS